MTRPRRVRFGSLRRLEPVSGTWGLDRGTPVDRVYIERFLDAHRDDVRGDVLEVGGNAYTTRFGRAGVTGHVLDNDRANHHATIVADLSDAPGVANEAFDCLIVTQVLQYVPDVRAALRTMHRILRPEGAALVTVPGIAQLDLHENAADTWRFTPRSLTHAAAEVFGPDVIEVRSWGNVLTSIAFLHGVAAEELRPREVAHDDARYPLLVTLRAVKQA